MTIQEAIKSGKPFRRKGDVKSGNDEWYVNRRPTAKYQWRLNYSYTIHKVIMNDILADDWEIKE
jgi:hypothetical protein